VEAGEAPLASGAASPWGRNCAIMVR
jgi:hypothetical protein